MRGEQSKQLGIGDEVLFTQVRPDHWLLRLDAMVEWSDFEPVWATLYGATGRPSHDPRVMFKMLLLEHWFGLSDPEAEEYCRDRLSFRRFLGLSLDDVIPDATALVRFRGRILERGALESLFAQVQAQLQSRGLLIKRGTLVDATIIRSARRAPAKNGSGTADAEAGWAVKGEQYTHGYKAHVAVDQDSGLVRGILATPGNTADVKMLEPLIRGDESAVYADKAYDDDIRRLALKQRGIEPRMLYKKRRHQPFPEHWAGLNRLWSKTRCQVERVFGDWKERRSLRRCRYLGLQKNQLHFGLLAIAHNLRRMTVLCPV